jgi:hypothetical protein
MQGGKIREDGRGGCDWRSIWLEAPAMPHGHEPVGSDQSELSLGDYKGCGGFVSERCMRMTDDLTWTPFSLSVCRLGTNQPPVLLLGVGRFSPDFSSTAGMAERIGAERSPVAHNRSQTFEIHPPCKSSSTQPTKYQIHYHYLRTTSARFTNDLFCHTSPRPSK